MMEIRSFDDAQAALTEFYKNQVTVLYNLDTIRALLAHVGNPQNSLRVVHIAGTSGKTSTAYFAASLLKTAGLKVGLTVSPHVDNLNERVQIDMVPLDETVFFAALEEFLKLVATSGLKPSYFEVMMAFAFWQFAREKVDYAVVEVGLGGLWDGTNVVERADKICVITDIGLDHTQILGNTIGEIAAQKAGIIQPGNEVFMYEQSADVMKSVAQRREQVADTTLHLVPSVSPSKIVNLPLFQERNFCLAEAVVKRVLERDAHQQLTVTQLQEASTIYIPARMERVRRGDKTIIIDGSHNAQKLETLFDSIDHEYPGVARAALVGFVEGDRFRLQESLAVLKRHVSEAIATSFQSDKDYRKQSVPLSEVLEAAKAEGWQEVSGEADPKTALGQLLARPEPLLIITGSFYLLNHVRPLLHLETAGT